MKEIDARKLKYTEFIKIVKDLLKIEKVTEYLSFSRRCKKCKNSFTKRTQLRRLLSYKRNKVKLITKKELKKIFETVDKYFGDDFVINCLI